MTTTQVLVKLADVQVLEGAAVLSCVGLGSCVGVAVYDPIAKVNGMAHVMLPESISDQPERPGKYANTAISYLVETMERLGAQRSRMVAAVGGGAQVCFGPTVPTMLALGSRNVQAIHESLKFHKVKCVGEDVGGSVGRTLTFDSATGRVMVRTATTPDRLLCTLK